jgi:uncharacterized protein
VRWIVDRKISLYDGLVWGPARRSAGITFCEDTIMSVNNTICWADIPVIDLDRAIKFYSAVLGSAVNKESAPGMDFGLLPHSENNVAGCLVKGNDFSPSVTGPLVYFNVNGRLDAAVVGVRDHGGKVIVEKHQIGPHGFRALVIDSEGNRIALHSKTA